MSGVSSKEWYDRFYTSRPRPITPWYRSVLEWLPGHRPAGPLLELGCGSGRLLEELAARSHYPVADLYGLEQSEVAVRTVASQLMHVQCGNIESPLPYRDEFFGVVVLSEVIEHLVAPWQMLERIHKLLAPDGVLLLSFPNYLNLPWLAVRVLGELLDRPSWTVLQPIDHMFIAPVVVRKLRERGFKVVKILGNVYFPPILYKFEPDWVRRSLNAACLGALSLHPLLISRKI